MTKRLVTGAAILATMLVGAGAVRAGFKATEVVFVSTVDRYAYGSLGSTRAASDSVQYIGCQVDGYPAPSAVGMQCRARMSNGTEGTCFSSDPRLVAVAAAVSGSTRVSFNYNAAGECTSVYIGNYSYNRPASP